MSSRFRLFVSLVLAAGAALPGVAAAKTLAPLKAEAASPIAFSTAPVKPVEIGPAAPTVAQLVARILEDDHYEHKAIGAKTSQDLMKLYLQMYDPNRMFFLKTDIDEFDSRFGADMAPRIKDGDAGAAYFIFNRFLKRVQERVDWVHGLVKSSYTFTSDDVMAIDRSKAPWPADEAAARELWRKRVTYDMLQEKLDKAKPADWAPDVQKRYDRLLFNYREFDSNDVLQDYLTALANTYDPHSDYMAAPEEENFDISMSLSLVGIGAVLESDEGYAKIVSLVPGGPADKSKRLHPNDRIEAVAQGNGPFVEAVGMKLDRLVEMIRGKKGTLVRLRILPADALDPSTRVAVSLVRDEIKLKDQEAKAKILRMPVPGGAPERLGVIELPSFYADMRSDGGESATRDVKTLVDYLKRQDVAGLILDLRDNGGGSLAEAVAMTGLFTGGGPVVQVRDNRGDIRVLRAPESHPDYTGPMVVLDSRSSASASEIVSAALKDYRRAVLVGEKSTFGKGTVQSIVDLDQYMPWSLRQYKAGALKLTIQKFYRISGGSTQNRGVIPDISLPSVDNELDMTESSLPNAMAYDQIPPAFYRRWSDVTPEKVERLRKDSETRVAASLNFDFVRQDIALYLKQKKDKTVSLNYAVRLAEQRQDQARALERKKELAASPAPPLAKAEITLEDIATDKPLVFSSTSVAVSSETASVAGSSATIAAAGVAVSSASAAGVAVSSAPAEGEDYARAPASSDFVLGEAAHVLADMIEAPPSVAAKAPAPGSSSSLSSKSVSPDMFIP